MLRHNLLLIFRNFKRFKSTFFINLTGLSTGIASALFIYLWVNNELNIDTHNEKDRRLFQVMQNIHDANGIQTGETTPGLLAKALAEEIPEIEFATSVVPSTWFPSKGILSFEGTRIRAAGQFIDKDYFNVFSCKIIRGNENLVLPDKYSIAISEELATSLFTSVDNAIGKTIEWNQGDFIGLYHITGVFLKPPSSATVQFDVLLNYELFFEKRPTLQYWGNSDPSTFVVLYEGTNLSQLNVKIIDFIKSKDKYSNKTLVLQRYSDKYLHGRYENGVQAGGRIEYVRLFSIIAIFILIIASVNYMNLSTAKASVRIKEVGIKKTIGVSRKALVVQYLGESMLITFLSLGLALILVEIFLPQFNEITQKNLALIFNTNLIISILGITFFTGLISGSYPALYLSGFKPAVILKGKLHSSVGEVWARKGLVIFQFAVSVILIVSVLIVYKQMEYAHSKNLGYNRDNILHFEIEIPGKNDSTYFAVGGGRENRVEVFLDEVRKIDGIVLASNFYHDLTGNHGVLNGVDWTEGTQDETFNFSNLEVGYDFIETLDIEMLAGRSYSRDFSSQSERSKIILNHAAIELMGLKDPIGKTIRLWGREKQIVGVTKNFHFESLFANLKPCLIQLEPRSTNIMVKIKGSMEAETIGRLQKLYLEFNPGLPFNYKFIDEDYQALYAGEKRVAILSRYFAGLAIIISCLGIFGLAAFTAERRLKEIGIRKIMGSSEFGIIQLLSGDFTKMVLTAIIIAVPASYFIAKNWLGGFAYRIELHWWYFLSPAILTLLIAWFTVGMQAIKASRINPAQCLKDE
jgi:ABC-type antimicrobial peptide transport system permease subunit